jgi:hypothetical protein
VSDLSEESLRPYLGVKRTLEVEGRKSRGQSDRTSKGGDVGLESLAGLWEEVECAGPLHMPLQSRGCHKLQLEKYAIPGAEAEAGVL